MNCSFNIRYKPRTTRVFTKSDLTVYDSAGNTALNALTVYGKSEVVDGAIKSAGEGWATVDLGTLIWDPVSEGNNCFYALISDTDENLPTFIAKYKEVSRALIATTDKAYCRRLSNVIIVHDSNFSTPTECQLGLSGVMLAYQLADPTQGNCIAVKTDNGSGIDGTMAVFETGTPLYGVSDSIRDVMQWDGLSGEVTKNCNKANASDLTWSWDASYEFWRSNSLINLIKPSSQNVLQSFIVTPLEYTGVTWQIFGSSDKTYSVSPSGTIGFKDTNYDSTKTPDFEFLYELATPTTEQLTTAENASIAGLRTFTPSTHAQNNAGATMTVDYTIRVPTI